MRGSAALQRVKLSDTQHAQSTKDDSRGVELRKPRAIDASAEMQTEEQFLTVKRLR